MGTNFFWLEPPEKCPHCSGEIERDYVDGGLKVPGTDPEHISSSRRGDHVGKRSAAGLYCYDCGVTLVAGDGQLARCSKCGKAPPDFSAFDRGAVAVELGFAKPEPKRPTGVFTAASFSWAIEPDGEDGARARLEKNFDVPIVIDEYGRSYTGRTFLAMLRANCPIEHRDTIGVHFS